MSDMKCPFCQQELKEITTSNPLGLGRIEMAVCKKCMDKGVLHIMPIWDWQELIRTRKALEIAVDALKKYTDASGNWWYGYEFQGHYEDYAGEYADKALEQITAQEQKDVK